MSIVRNSLSVLLLSASILAAGTGCQNKKKTDETKTTKDSTAATTGTTMGDSSATTGSTSAGNAEAQAMLQKKWTLTKSVDDGKDEDVANQSIEFTADGKMKMIKGDEAKETSYTLAADGKSFMMDDGTGNKIPLTITTLTNEKLVFTSADGKSMTEAEAK